MLTSCRDVHASSTAGSSLLTHPGCCQTVGSVGPELRWERCVIDYSGRGPHGLVAHGSLVSQPCGTRRASWADSGVWTWMKPSPRAAFTVRAGGARSPGSAVGGAPGRSSHPPGGPQGPGHVSGAASGQRSQAGEHRGGSGSRCAGWPGRLCVVQGTRLCGGGDSSPGCHPPRGRKCAHRSRSCVCGV